MIRLYGYETAAQQRTFNTYEDVHCLHSAGLHDYLKYLKLGYGKVTDHASREIRLKRMTRREGIEMVRKYSEVVPDDIEIFLDWLGMNRDEFMKLVWDRRDPRIWEKSGHEWVLRDSVINHADDPGVDDVALELKEDCEFQLTGSQEPESLDTRYTLMGRSYFNKDNYGAVECTTHKGALSDREYEGYLSRSYPHIRKGTFDEVL